jgi:hypothetical protein
LPDSALPSQADAKPFQKHTAGEISGGIYMWIMWVIVQFVQATIKFLGEFAGEKSKKKQK